MIMFTDYCTLSRYILDLNLIGDYSNITIYFRKVCELDLTDDQVKTAVEKSLLSEVRISLKLMRRGKEGEGGTHKINSHYVVC